MGSLMSGWDSPTEDPKYVKEMRNKSLTKDDIEEYWKLRKQTEQEHLNSISPITSEVSLRSEEFGNEEFGKRTKSLPVIDTKAGHLKPALEADIDVVDLLKKNCWWTRSNWAFLNEAPVIDSDIPRRYRYASQHHVANLGLTKPDSSRISIK